MYQMFLLVPVLLALAQSKDTKIEWLPDDMYNPQYEPDKCGLKSGEPAYVCDPNGIVGNHSKYGFYQFYIVVVNSIMIL